MLARAELVAFLATANPPRAREFYGELLGLALVDSSQFALEFAAANARLRVAIVAQVEPAPYTVAGWRVDDIYGGAQSLVAAGVEPLRYDGLEQDERGIWRAPTGAHVLWFADPDGNVLSLTQLRV
jgi:catechol 2,3-dioxygenase-like lactoylglutathione lyase family enzyme